MVKPHQVSFYFVITHQHVKHDIDLIEKVQRRFTKRLYDLKSLSYADQLTKLGLCSLELRRLQLDLILCYKIVLAWLMSVLLIFSHLACF